MGNNALDRYPKLGSIVQFVAPGVIQVNGCYFLCIMSDPKPAPEECPPDSARERFRRYEIDRTLGGQLNPDGTVTITRVPYQAILNMVLDKIDRNELTGADAEYAVELCKALRGSSD